MRVDNVHVCEGYGEGMVYGCHKKLLDAQECEQTGEGGEICVCVNGR